MNKKIVLGFVLLHFVCSTYGQELQARLTVSALKINSQVDKKIFQTLQSGLINFLNNRKWTPDTYQPNEKIQCNFFLSIEQDLGNNVFKGKLTVQAARPVLNSAYQSPLINYLDDDVTFRYVEFQPIEFNENRIQGSDPVAANLTAIFAYYVDIILGFDYDSFSPRGGDIYFQKAWNIVNNAPESSNISGWKPFDGQRNRYWLAENLHNNQYALIHDAIYAYYRSGLDNFYDNENNGRNGVMNCINYLNTINSENPNSMILSFFLQGKSSELIKVFSHADAGTKIRARDILQKIDITNIAAYKELK
ncbi:MAG: DUF4835 domain-containing protein [Sphingobacteriales bacterium UTBCD1]|jgi:hypothetical protein|nr:MAG: DUF4835 domain-containing protein [Sphingobacteriales bacterium UTBCD1]